MEEVKIPILDEITPQELNQLAEKYAEVFVRQDRLKTHQLRNVFSSIERMRTKHKSEAAKKQPFKNSGAPESSEEREQRIYKSVENDLVLLKPKIAYAAGRQKTVRYNFFPFVKGAIDGVTNAKDKGKALTNFFALMESVVGYHKFFENA